MSYTKIKAEGSMDKFTLTITNVPQPLVYKHGWMSKSLIEGEGKWKDERVKTLITIVEPKDYYL